LKDAQRVVQEGRAPQWGQVLQLPENKNKAGLGFTPAARSSVAREPFEDIFRSAGFINAIIEDKGDEAPQSYVTPGGICNNWTAVDVPTVTHFSK
jgi:hypothetical protein